MTNPTVALQQRNNSQTRDAWDRFLPHREHLHQLIVAGFTSEERRGRVALLGAGNCNDLDLAALAGCFQEITLIDLDETAVAEGISRQFPDEQSEEMAAARSRLRIVAPIDLGGLAEPLAAIVGPLDAAATAECIAQMQVAVTAAGDRLLEQGPFDVVVSAGLLTQLFHAVAERFAAMSPEQLQLLIAIRQAHFDLLFRLTAQHGRTLFVTDFVSSLTAPDLATASEEQLPARLQQLIAQQNFFTGCNPRGLYSDLTRRPALQSRPQRIIEYRPWLWNVLPHRTYLVWGVGVQFE